jgi:hypothetical protein
MVSRSLRPREPVEAIAFDEKKVENPMKQIAALLVLLCTMTFLSAAYAGTPYYGGGKHTTSHGGQYPGATNSHHRDGHYSNWQSGNRYGVHKP